MTVDLLYTCTTDGPRSTCTETSSARGRARRTSRGPGSPGCQGCLHWQTVMLVLHNHTFQQREGGAEGGGLSGRQQQRHHKRYRSCQLGGSRRGQSAETLRHDSDEQLAGSLPIK